MLDSSGRIAQGAGRYSVFAKSDMIHLQQKAVPADEIAAGRCYALARNYLATLCRCRTPSAPVLFQGGVAANNGEVRAFRDLLNLDADGLIVPEHFEALGALGAALIAGERPLSALLAIMAMIDALSRRPADGEDGSGLEPLAQKSIAAAPRPAAACTFENTYVLGIDVGSVSTKAAVVDSAYALIAAAYLPTAGDRSISEAFAAGLKGKDSTRLRRKMLFPFVNGSCAIPWRSLPTPGSGFFQNTVSCRKNRLLNRLKKDQKRGAVLLGRPYNTTDRHVTLNLARRLKGFGVEPIPFDFLPLEREPLPPLRERLRWGATLRPRP